MTVELDAALLCLFSSWGLKGDLNTSFQRNNNHRRIKPRSYRFSIIHRLKLEHIALLDMLFQQTRDQLPEFSIVPFTLCCTLTELLMKEGCICS